METHIETIRLAVAEDATVESRASGAIACRAILATLEPAHSNPIAPSRLEAAQIASIAATIRSVPMDQLLDLAIAKLRTIAPHDVTQRAPAFSVPFIQVPRP